MLTGSQLEAARLGFTNFAIMMASRDRPLRRLSPLQGACLGMKGSRPAFPFLGSFFLVQGL
jgi:hypothetical protein